MSMKQDPASREGYGSIPQEVVMENDEPLDLPTPSLKAALIAEVFGTCILVQVGCGGLSSNLYVNGLSGAWHVAAIWASAATLAIFSTASISGAHLNPAVTLSFALVRRAEFSWKGVFPYWIAQLVGAMAGGAMNLVLFHTAINRYERKHGITRGDDDSIESATGFSDYWSLSRAVSGSIHALFIEAFGTAFLTFVIFAVTHPKNPLPGVAVAPAAGIAIGMLVAILGPLTGTGFNPARELGPRLVTAMAGWGKAAMTDTWIYIVGPLIGGPVGAFLAEKVLMVD